MYINQNLDESNSIVLSFFLSCLPFPLFSMSSFVALNRLNRISFLWNVGWLTVRFPNLSGMSCR